MQANYVTFHTYTSNKQSLHLSASLGFDESAANLLKCVTFDDSNSFALAMNAKSIFVLNIEDSDFLLTPNLLGAYRLAGICSVLLSPLFSSSKELLGVLSIHWKTENEPSERELSLLNLLLGQSAALMEQFYERIAMMEDNLWLISQKEAFHSAISRKPLEHSLRTLIDTVILQTKGSGTAAFYLIPANNEFFNPAARLEEEYPQIFKLFPDEPHFVDWSLIMKTGEPIITSDIESDPAWKDLRVLARKHNCRACWSFPVHTSDDLTLGTLCIYFTEPREPTKRELEMANVLTNAASIIISHEYELVAKMQTERAMRTSEQKLMKQVRSRDEFIANAVHELSSPLTCMNLYMEIIDQAFLEKNTFIQIEILNKLKKQLELLETLIRDMLDTTQLEEGKLHLNLETFHLNPLIIEKIQEMQLRANNCQFDTDLAIEDEIKADKGRIGQVITNLISNAIKYSPQGSKILITSETTDSVIQVNVIDRGLGVPQKDLENIFEPFYRVLNEHIPGMGIGLSLCKDIISNHHGTIKVTSQVGVGSTFSFTIPKRFS